MKKIVAVGNEQFTLGFRLLGADEQLTLGDARAAFAAAMKDDYGVIVTNEEAMAQLSPEARHMIASSINPVVVVIDQEESMRAQIVRALGIDLWHQ